MPSSAPPIGLDLTQRFLVRRDDEIIGPFDVVELAARLRDGAIAPADLLQRQGRTTWQPFAALPEFAILKAMPVETIAYHLEHKARAARPRPPATWYKSAPFLLFVFGAVLVAAVLSVIYVPPGTPSPAPKPPPPPWKVSIIGGVTVECPVTFQLLPAKKSPFLTSYWADVPDAHFGVDIRFANVPDDARAIEVGFDFFERAFLTNCNGTVLSETPFTVDGHQGRDVLFTSTQYGATMPGGLRMLAGGKELVMAWTIAHTKNFGSDEINRYITSFHFN